MRSSAVRDALAPQDFLYTQATLGKKTSFRIIGSILDILVAPDDPAAVVDAVADSQIRLVTTTITEKGYCISSGKIDRQHRAFRQDLSTLTQPQTIYGYLAAAIIRRCINSDPALTIVCCDNIQNGGSCLRSGVNQILEAHYPRALVWATQCVAFVSSMVDRVTPSSGDDLKQLVASNHGLEDAWPVAAEPFSQWVIENGFIGPRPPLDKAGALFVDDVAPYELMKLRFLNAAHSIISSLAYLCGDHFIHEALRHKAVFDFVKLALTRNVLPVAVVPKGSDPLKYIDLIFDRFQNSLLPYSVLQVGSDSSQKIQQRLLPTIDDALEHQGDAHFLSFALAAWVAFIQKALEKDELDDVLRKQFSQVQPTSGEDMVVQFLRLAGAQDYRFFKNADFMISLMSHHQAIAEFGIEPALIDFLESTGKRASHA